MRNIGVAWVGENFTDKEVVERERDICRMVDLFTGIAIWPEVHMSVICSLLVARWML